MQVIVQEGTATVSLTAEMQSADEALRTLSLRHISGPVRVFYRDYQVVRVEAQDGAIELLPGALAGILWLEKGRRYQLKAAP